MEVARIYARTGVALRMLWSWKLMKAHFQDEQIKEADCECCTQSLGQLLKCDHAACKGLGQDLF